jgi:hypothetical protein
MRYPIKSMNLISGIILGVVLGTLMARLDFAKRPALEGWERGEYDTYRKTLKHECGGQFVFNGHAKPAPYCDGVNFCEHVCDKCNATNQVLNATWPQHKREWRSL